jgi:hypothetical protein
LCGEGGGSGSFYCSAGHLSRRRGGCLGSGARAGVCSFLLDPKLVKKLNKISEEIKLICRFIAMVRYLHVIKSESAVIEHARGGAAVTQVMV